MTVKKSRNCLDIEKIMKKNFYEDDVIELLKDKIKQVEDHNEYLKDKLNRLEDENKRLRSGIREIRNSR